MKRFSYGERDSAFGQAMLTLRTTIGLTQAGLAHPGVVSAVTWAPSGERLISDGRLRWWEVHSGQCIRVREAHQGTIQALKVSPDGRKLASCGDDGTIMLWDLHGGEHLRTLRRDRPYERLDITGVKGLTQAQKATLRGLGATEDTPAPITQQAP